MNSCSTSLGVDVVAVGATVSCRVAAAWPGQCTAGDSQSDNVNDYLPSLNGNASTMSGMTTSSAYGSVSGHYTISGTDPSTGGDGATTGSITFTRAAPGAVTLYIYVFRTAFHSASIGGGADPITLTCEPDGGNGLETPAAYAITIN